ncbi:MAG TPA: TonB-dependent receptor [Edaphocola sp.]|nr:TonB-dependent receptor [Edaphocola sp.]
MNQLIQKYTLVSLILGLSATTTFAQNRNDKDTTFKSQTLDFYSTYKPEVAPAPKPKFIPALPKADTGKPHLTYDVPELSTTYTYQAKAIKPLSLKRDAEVLPFANYLKLGIGSQNSVLVDAGYAGLKGENFETIFHFNHFSQKGRFVQHQKWSQNTLDAIANIYLDKGTLKLDAQGDRRAFRDYGYNNDIYSFLEKDILNVYSGLNLAAQYTPIGTLAWNIKAQPKVELYWWNNKMGATEGNVDVELPISKDIDSSITIAFDIKTALTQFTDDSFHTFGNNYLQINPVVSLRYDYFTAKIGIKPVVGKYNNFLLPDIAASGLILNDQLKWLVGWEGKLNQNTYKELSLFNPYMQTYYTPIHGRENFLYAGFETFLGPHLTIGATAGYKSWRNKALFYNDYINSVDGSKFEIIYDDIKAIVLNAKVQYQFNDNLEIGGSADMNFFKPFNPSRVQQMPGFALTAHAKFKPIQKLYLGADLIFYENRYALNAANDFIKMPTILDLNLNASYDVHKRFTVFAQVDNLFNYHYEYWNQYRSVGLALLTGLRFKF